MGEVWVEVFPLFAGNSQYLQNFPIFYRLSTVPTLILQGIGDFCPASEKPLSQAVVAPINGVLRSSEGVLMLSS
jgi:hypothetical protein